MLLLSNVRLHYLLTSNHITNTWVFHQISHFTCKPSTKLLPLWLHFGLSSPWIENIFLNNTSVMRSRYSPIECLYPTKVEWTWEYSLNNYRSQQTQLPWLTISRTFTQPWSELTWESFQFYLMEPINEHLPNWTIGSDTNLLGRLHT